MKTELLVMDWSLLKSKKLYKWPFSVTNNTKLILFQFKINHTIIYTKDKLKRANIIPDDLSATYVKVNSTCF